MGISKGTHPGLSAWRMTVPLVHLAAAVWLVRIDGKLLPLAPSCPKAQRGSWRVGDITSAGAHLCTQVLERVVLGSTIAEAVAWVESNGTSYQPCPPLSPKPPSHGQCLGQSH